MTDKHLEPPEHLTDASRELWQTVTSDYALDPSGLLLLEALLDTLERYHQARDVIAREGAYVEGRFGVKPHPAVMVERDCRTAIARLVRELDLEGLPLPEPKRPARRGGVG